MIARIELLTTPPLPEDDRVRGAAAVVVDVLRATTVIATALANGAAAVVPVLDPGDAIVVAGRLGRSRTLLCGERESVRIAGFDLDNSPAAYTRDAVAGKTLVFTTTNGTRAIERARGAATIRTAGLVNRRAVAAALLAEAPERVTILCAGTHGAFDFADFVTAGALVDLLAGAIPEANLDDAARAAALLYRSVADVLPAAIASSDHARGLAALGFADDVVACARRDVLDVAPIVRDGALVVA